MSCEMGPRRSMWRLSDGPMKVRTNRREESMREKRFGGISVFNTVDKAAQCCKSATRVCYPIPRPKHHEAVCTRKLHVYCLRKPTQPTPSPPIHPIMISCSYPMKSLQRHASYAAEDALRAASPLPAYQPPIHHRRSRAADPKASPIATGYHHPRCCLARPKAAPRPGCWVLVRRRK